MKARYLTGRGVNIRNVEPIRGARFSQHLESAPTGFPLDPGSGNLVYIVARLTRDIERFESMVANERQLLQQNALQADAFNDHELGRQSARLRVGATEVATHARVVLDELQRLSGAGERNRFERFERSGMRVLSEDQPAG